MFSPYRIFGVLKVLSRNVSSKIYSVSLHYLFNRKYPFTTVLIVLVVFKSVIIGFTRCYSVWNYGSFWTSCIFCIFSLKLTFQYGISLSFFVNEKHNISCSFSGFVLGKFPHLFGQLILAAKRVMQKNPISFYLFLHRWSSSFSYK